jgi:hypothetical protein
VTGAIAKKGLKTKRGKCGAVEKGGRARGRALIVVGEIWVASATTVHV